VDGFAYLDQHDNCRPLDQLSIEILYLHHGVHMRTLTWEIGLQLWLDYFIMVDNIPICDHVSLAHFNIMVHTYPYDPGIWLHIIITIFEDETFIRGTEWTVYR
jgi:hypothetical protein